jgi:hypothetical protein
MGELSLLFTINDSKGTSPLFLNCVTHTWLLTLILNLIADLVEQGLRQSHRHQLAIPIPRHGHICERWQEDDSIQTA